MFVGSKHDGKSFWYCIFDLDLDIVPASTNSQSPSIQALMPLGRDPVEHITLLAVGDVDLFDLVVKEGGGCPRRPGVEEVRSRLRTSSIATCVRATPGESCCMSCLLRGRKQRACQ